MDNQNQIFYPDDSYWIFDREQVHLIGSHCKSCHQNYFPPRNICPKCFAKNGLEKIKLDSTGKLYSYSIVHVGPNKFSPPYALGYVDFPENVRVLGQLTTIDPDQLSLDMEVKTIIGKISIDDKGNEIFSYKFEPL